MKRNAFWLIAIVGGVLLALVSSRVALAQEHETALAPANSTGEVHPGDARPGEAHSGKSHSGGGPVLPADPSAWAGTMLILIVAMFLMAAVIGPMVRMEIPVESHDDHGHGDHGHEDYAHGNATHGGHPPQHH
ncbi:hypothetical protein BH09PLA1_BH09PLA1_35860 [soil metagenome]